MERIYKMTTNKIKRSGYIEFLYMSLAVFVGKLFTTAVIRSIYTTTPSCSAVESLLTRTSSDKITKREMLTKYNFISLNPKTRITSTYKNVQRRKLINSV